MLQWQWTQTRLHEGIDVSMRQLQALLTGMKLPLPVFDGSSRIADLAPMVVGFIHAPRTPEPITTSASLQSLGSLTLA